MNVFWTPESIKTFEQIIENLNTYWSQKEINKFVEQTEFTVNLIIKNPYLYKPSEKNKNIRKGFINKLVSMFYRVNLKNNEIEIITFWNNRQNPKKNIIK